MPGLILSAPSSGAGKTTVTLGILSALKRRGVSVRSAKSGPDYIDPQFHAAATGQVCLTLDAWAMTPKRLQSLASTDDLLIVEGAMGLFDGAPPHGRGSTADLAKALSLPVVLVLDCARVGHSIAATVAGFAGYDADLRIAGLILNNLGSEKHKRIITSALKPSGIPILGALPRDTSLSQPSRHLGLVQAHEHADLRGFLTTAADLIDKHIDLEGLISLAQPLSTAPSPPQLPPPCQTIAVAQDTAFAFSYPHLLRDWQMAGATLSTFSPLNNDVVPPAELIYLPGGYPELHAGKLASNKAFLDSLNIASQTSQIYGECGGYMVLGQTLTDAEGTAHTMAGLLNLHTSFAQGKLHLGYRNLHAQSGPFSGHWSGHEFHYASTLSAIGDPLFTACDAEGAQLEPMGLTQGNVSGSFAHLIDNHFRP